MPAYPAERRASGPAAAALPQRFRTIEGEMRDAFLERADPIRGLLLGLLSGQHAVLLGPPGTGKSALASDLCGRIAGAAYFPWLLTRFSTPEELFGPVSLKALEQDSYRRVTAGKLPEAHVAFLDETFKANSAVLNALLGVLNERTFHNDGTPTWVPLLMAVGASNELPEDREELGALWDRFGLRYTVGYLREDASFVRMLRGAGGQRRTTVTLDQVHEARAGVAAVRLNGTLAALTDLRRKLADLKIPVSDRRWKGMLPVLQANAWLEGRDTTGEDDMLVLAHALWQEPSQIVQVRQAVLAVANPLLQRTAELLDQAREVHGEVMAAWAESQKDPAKSASGAALEAVKKLRKVIADLEQVRSECTARGRDATRVAAGLEETVRMQEEVLIKCLGLKPR